MNQSTYVKLALVTFGLILVNFVILGFGRVLLSYETAQLLAMPVTVVAVALMAYLFVRAVLAKLGVWEIYPDQTES